MKITTNKLLGLCGAFLLSLLVAPGLSAAPITFELSNHPDAAISPPGYGLRLDGLYSGDAGDNWTFDFNHESSDMKLVYDADLGSIRIFGDLYGGRVSGSDYVSGLAGSWSVDFTYSVGVTSTVSGDDFALKVGEDHPDNAGSLTANFTGSAGGITVEAGDVISLEDEDGGKSYAFKFNNTDDHRLGGHGLSGPDTFVGWGWVNHSVEPGALPQRHLAASDWLFTAKRVEVPEPGTLALLSLGVAGLALSRRRRTA